MAVITGLVLLLFFAVASAEEWHEKYDQNTEITVRGKIAKIVSRDRGPVVIEIVKNQKLYKVVTAPKWFLEESLYELRLNDEVVIQGSRFVSKKGEIFIIARQIHNISNGRVYALREDQGLIPKWRQKGKRKNREDF